MSLFYVTGISGAGKSTAKQELSRRGHKTYGLDEDGIARFVNTTTGELVWRSTAEERTEEWRKQHRYEIDEQRFKEIHAESENKDIFVCGVAANDTDFFKFFSKVFALTVDKETMQQRIRDRTNNNSGKNPHEFAALLEWQKTARQDYINIGAIIIDSTQPIASVVNDILREAGL